MPVQGGELSTDDPFSLPWPPFFRSDTEAERLNLVLVHRASSWEIQNLHLGLSDPIMVPYCKHID